MSLHAAKLARRAARERSRRAGRRACSGYPFCLGCARCLPTHTTEQIADARRSRLAP